VLARAICLSIPQLLASESARLSSAILSCFPSSLSSSLICPIYVADDTTSVQAILDANDLAPGDLIYVQAGPRAGFTVSSDDAGVTIIGSPDFGAVIGGPVTTDGAGQVILQRLGLAGGLTVTGSDDFTLYDTVVTGAAGLTLDGGDNAHVHGNRFAVDGTAVELTGGVSDVLIRDNAITGGTVGVALTEPAGGQVRDNAIVGASTGLDIAAAFVGAIDHNTISGATTAVDYLAPAALGANDIHHSNTGIHVAVSQDADSLGFVGQTEPNRVHDNTAGILLTDSRVKGQHVFDNLTGIAGSGTVGGDDLDEVNLIEGNTTGVSIDGQVHFNRIAGNGVGVETDTGQAVRHNVFYRNTGTALRVNGDSGVVILHNTFFEPTADAIRITGGSSAAEVRNNIVWAQVGYGIYVDDDSQGSFFSDYNLLHTGDSGTLVHWLFDFDDILDWQEDVHRYDLHSIGRTDVNPQWSRPQFYSQATDDYRVFDLTAGWRFASPTIDAADPLVDNDVFELHTNLLTNAGFEGGLTGWSASVGSEVRDLAPVPFEGESYFYPGQLAYSVLEQTVDLLAAGFSALELDGRDLYALFGARVRSANEAASDEGEITIAFLDGTDSVIEQRTVVTGKVHNRWELIGERALVPIGTRKVRFTYAATRATGPGNDAYLDGASVRLAPETAAADLGALGHMPTDVDHQTAHLALRWPDLYTDWERGSPRAILWDSYGNVDESLVRIDLYQDAPDGPALLANIVYGKGTGILTDGGSGGLAVENRVYDNSTGIAGGRGSALRGNVAYSNVVGIHAAGIPGQAWRTFTGEVTNNLVYANDHVGILVTGAVSPSRFLNNTVYQPAGKAVEVANSSTDVELRNNILQAGQGHVIYVAPDSQLGFASDHNLLYAAPAGSVGFWQEQDRETLANWQAAAFTDASSFAQAPLFVAPAGGDGQLGYVDAANDGRDDDFHLQSTVGRFTGSLAPVLDPATGLPVFLASAEFSDAAQSPAIDRGDESFDYADEPAPNGGYINLGAHGNTPHASKSPVAYVLVTGPDGGEIWPAERTFDIRWRSHDTAGTVDVELIRDGDAGFLHVIASGAGNSGRLSWPVPDDPVGVPAGDDYRIRVMRGDASGFDESNAPFTIIPPIHEYYVNIAGDADFGDNEYTTAAGARANTGLGPDYPLDSIRAVLDTHAVEPGDIIYVDTGTYALAGNVTLTSAESGITIIGPQQAGHEAVLDRGSISVGSYVFELIDADGVTLDHLTVTGGVDGINLRSDSDGLTVSNSRIQGNQRTGIRIDEQGNDGVTIDGNAVFANGGGYDGGPDDNFMIAGGSPAIDRADTWAAPNTDIDGVGPVDDPGMPNLGTEDYFEQDTGAVDYAETGTAQHMGFWRQTLEFPEGFTFPFYGQEYSSVHVYGQGFLLFGEYVWYAGAAMTTERLIADRVIVPFGGSNVGLYGLGDDVYVDTSQADRVTFRFDGSSPGGDVNAAVTLWETGKIEFHYGPGNAGQAAPVGISAGDGRNYVLSMYDGRSDLADANTVEFVLQPAFADIGAYEFRGSSLDTTAPVVLATAPPAVDARGSTSALVSEIEATFSEALNNVDARAVGNYDLRTAGPNGVFNDGDDVVLALVPQYVMGSTMVTLAIDGGPLAPGEYRLTISGRESIHDLAGLRLDGDRDGQQGGDYVRTFTVQKILTWDGTDLADWTSAHWNPGPGAPGGGEAMVVDSGVVEVSADLTAIPAASLDIASGAAGGTVNINDDCKLLVTGQVDVGLGGTLNVDGVLAAAAVDVTGGLLTNSRGSAAAVAVEGDVALGGGGTFMADVIGGGADTLVSSGAVTLGANASLEIVPAGGGKEFRAGTYTLIEAGGGLTGTFANVTVPWGYVSVNGNGLTYDEAAGTVTLTLDKDLNPGDGNLDGATDVSDRIIWNNHNFTFGTTFTTGDFNNDGATDVSDRIIWNNHNFTFATATPLPRAAGVAPQTAGPPGPMPQPGTPDMSGRATAFGAAATGQVPAGRDKAIRIAVASTTQPAPARSPSSNPAERPVVPEASSLPAESEDWGPSRVTGILVAQTASQLELDLDTDLTNPLAEPFAPVLL